MRVCEFCGLKHDWVYGCGRFCSRVCSYRGRRKDCKKITWRCEYCGEFFSTRRDLYKHKHEKHKIKKIWNKGLTKETDERVARAGRLFSLRIKNGEIIASGTGRKVSAETKKKISESMKIAHAEGRAHNIGRCRWRNQPSYPEQFFIKVIQNEFNDKNFKREFPFGRFSLDFAWEHKKRCVEIDGEQHRRFEEYRNRDKRKDELLQREGWKVLRIVWKEMFSNPQKWIAIAKEFIGD